MTSTKAGTSVNFDAIIEEIQSGKIDESEGYKIIHEQLHPYILRVISNVAEYATEEEKEDIASIVWQELWDKRSEFDGSLSSFKTWSSMIAHRRTVDYVRSQKRKPGIESIEHSVEMNDYSTFTERTPLEEIVQKELRDATLRLLMDLPELDRTLYLIYLSMDITHKELSEIVSKARNEEISERAVQNRIYRARAALMKKLSQEGV
jgi:RNA polymerase sigma factor (sigma-70 family)